MPDLGYCYMCSVRESEIDDLKREIRYMSKQMNLIENDIIECVNKFKERNIKLMNMVKEKKQIIDYYREKEKTEE